MFFFCSRMLARKIPRHRLTKNLLRPVLFSQANSSYVISGSNTTLSRYGNKSYSGKHSDGKLIKLLTRTFLYTKLEMALFSPTIGRNRKNGLCNLSNGSMTGRRCGGFGTCGC